MSEPTAGPHDEPKSPQRDGSQPPPDIEPSLRPSSPRSSPEEPSRRSFLRRSVAIVPAAALSGVAGLSGCEGSRSQSRQRVATPETAQHRPQFFNEIEWACLIALCSRMIPEDDEGPGAVSTGVPIFIDRQLEGPYGFAAGWYMQGPFADDAAPEFGYQSRATPRELYRVALAAIDRHSEQRYGKRFAEISASQQDELLKAIDDDKLGPSANNGDASLHVPAGADLSTFFELFTADVHNGYLADPIHGGNRAMASWKMIGFPGARADFVDWVERRNQPYPLGPVSIDGQRG